MQVFKMYGSRENNFVLRCKKKVHGDLNHVLSQSGRGAPGGSYVKFAGWVGKQLTGVTGRWLVGRFGHSSSSVRFLFLSLILWGKSNNLTRWCQMFVVSKVRTLISERYTFWLCVNSKGVNGLQKGPKSAELSNPVNWLLKPPPIDTHTYVII